MVVFTNILQYANMPICCLMINPCARHIQLHVYIYILNYIYIHLCICMCIYIYMHMFSTCIDFIPMCIYVYLCVYICTCIDNCVHRKGTAQRTVSEVHLQGTMAPWHRPGLLRGSAFGALAAAQKGLDGSPFGWTVPVVWAVFFKP